MCHSWGTTARAHVQGNSCSRSRERLDRSRSNLVYWWGLDKRVMCKSKLGPTLHVRACRLTVPDLKNGWIDWAQIWYTVRDRLVRCHQSQLEAPPRSSARAGLSLSLSRLSPPKGVLLVCIMFHIFSSQAINSWHCNHSKSGSVYLKQCYWMFYKFAW